jgi:hypothetical protein
VTRFAALLLALLLVLPRAALGAVLLRCGHAVEREQCCCCHKKKAAPEPRLERAPCCKPKAPGNAPSTPATEPSKPLLPALALAAPLVSDIAPPRPELVAVPRPEVARGPPARKTPIFLSHCALLH